MAVPLKNVNSHKGGESCISSLESRLLNFPVFFKQWQDLTEKDVSPDARTPGCVGGVA